LQRRAVVRVVLSRAHFVLVNGAFSVSHWKRFAPSGKTREGSSAASLNRFTSLSW